MARLPQPGSDSGQWGEILNEYLTQSHETDGSLRAGSVGSLQLQSSSVITSTLAPESVTLAKLSPAAIEALGNANLAATNSAIDARRITHGAHVDPRDFGAIGNGTSNDSAAIQSAITYLESQGGGTLVIPRNARFYIPDGIFICRNAPVPVSLLGTGGVLYGGTVTVGPATPARGGLSVSGMSIDGISFEGITAYGGGALLLIGGVRGLDIVNCYFKNASVGIDTYGDTEFHSLAMLRIASNRFGGLLFAVRHLASTWDYASDWDIVDNFVNLAADTSFWITNQAGTGGGVDGLNFQGNVMFHLSASSIASPLWQSKRHNLRVGKSDWLRIINNNFFEAGLEAVYLHEARRFVYTGNHIAWAGQRERSSQLKIVASPIARGVISNNVFDLFTHSAIGFSTTNLAEVTIGENQYRWEADNPRWLGNTPNATLEPLTTSNCFRIYADTACYNYPYIRSGHYANGLSDSIRDTNMQGRDPRSELSGIGAAKIITNIPATDTVVFSLSDIVNVSIRGGGLITVNVRRTGASNDYTANYLLFVSIQGSVCTVVASGGRTGGADANEPSFTWSIVGSNLCASRVGATSSSSTFAFEALSFGALQMK